MLRLITYIGENDGGGAVSWASVGYAALVAFGPLAGAIGDAHTFQLGWLMGTKLRVLFHGLAGGRHSYCFLFYTSPCGFCYLVRGENEKKEKGRLPSKSETHGFAFATPNVISDIRGVSRGVIITHPELVVSEGSMEKMVEQSRSYTTKCAR